jgi:hypothetical protein
MFVLVIGGLLTVIAIIDRGGLTDTSDGSTGCQLEVAADTLNIRSGPSQQAPLVDTLARGAVVDGTTVVTDGFRQLENDRWADNRYLAPTPGSRCS